MSTDYKIGIVVGLVVLIAGIVYFIASGEPDPGDAPPVGVPTTKPNEIVEAGQESPEATPSAEGTPLVEVPLSPAPQPAAGAATPGTGQEVVRPTLSPATPTATGWQLNPDATTAQDAPATPAAASESTATVQISPAPSTDSGFQLDADADTALREPDPEPIIRPIVRPTATENLGAGGTYVVRSGDNGFWIIAERVYGPGKGKYWTLIQRANPTADTNALREGQMLKIPSLPSIATRRPSAATRRADYGRVISNTDGKRTYVVAEGEAGLWGVSEKVYGKGIYWEHIQRANPKARPSALRPGMKLIIPPLPKTAPQRDSTTTTIRPAGTARRPLPKRGQVYTENGRRYYVVKAGDKGYWTVAKKVYGNGKYSYLIDRANPGVDTDSLQPGDKLLVPPKPAGAPASTVRARPARPVRSDEPDFGP